MFKWLAQGMDAVAEGFGAAVADVRDKIVFEGWFGLKTAERHRDADLGWSLDRSGAAENAIGAPERGSPISPIDVRDRSMSITSGWDFAKESACERDGPGIER